MLPDSDHLADQDLLLWADGELPPRRAAAIARHLSACWTCRARMTELEHTIARFISVYRESGPDVPPIDGPRALFRARLTDSTAAPIETPSSPAGGTFALPVAPRLFWCWPESARASGSTGSREVRRSAQFQT